MKEGAYSNFLWGKNCFHFVTYAAAKKEATKDKILLHIKQKQESKDYESISETKPHIIMQKVSTNRSGLDETIPGSSLVESGRFLEYKATEETRNTIKEDVYT